MRFKLEKCYTEQKVEGNMGLKSIEMQVAIPRSQDAGKMQDDLSRQGQRFQERITEEQLRAEVRQRSRTERQEKTLKRNINDNKNNQNHHEPSGKKQKKKKKQSIQHPYLGRQIDWSG